MAGRGQIPSAYKGRSVQGPGMMRHGSIHGLGPAGHRPMDPLPPPDRLETKLVVQVAEIERLAGENHILSAAHVAMRQDISAAQKEIQRLREHIRSIQTEGDIQIRVLLDKRAKMEVDIRSGENVKKELQQALTEAQSLVRARQELTTQIQQATSELDTAHADLKNLPDMYAELDSLRQEHQRLRNTFEHEKGMNMEKVEQMQAMEKNLMGMAREVEKLRAKVSNAERRALAPDPYADPYTNPAPMHGTAAYVDSYGRSYGQNGVVVAADGTIRHGNGVPVPTTGVPSVWGGAYDAALPPR